MRRPLFKLTFKQLAQNNDTDRSRSKSTQFIYTVLNALLMQTDDGWYNVTTGFSKDQHNVLTVHVDHDDQ